MATHSQGISVTWGGITFQEVTDLQWTYGGRPKKGRDAPWDDFSGQVTITCLNSAGVNPSLCDTLDLLAIHGGGATLTCYAIYEAIGVACEVNGVTRYTVTLKLVDG